MRGHSENPDIDLLNLSIVVAITLVVGYVMMSVMSKITPEKLEKFEDQTVTHCSALGCGSPFEDVFGLFGVALIVVILAVMCVHLVSIRAPRDDSSDGASDPVVVVQEKYVDGEIQTEAQLERELEWYLYPEENGDDTDD